MASREHTCNCGFTWVAEVQLSAHTPDLSGEATQYCPRCHERAVMSSPYLPAVADLVQAQFRQYPDSRILSVSEVIQDWVDEDGLTEAQRARVTRSLAFALQCPVKVFYECGKRPNSTYAWRGCRFGTEGREYLSGFGRY
jgi:hypothetical protein